MGHLPVLPEQQHKIFSGLSPQMASAFLWAHGEAWWKAMAEAAVQDSTSVEGHREKGSLNILMIGFLQFFPGISSSSLSVGPFVGGL